jgi:hypothetical protein
VAQSVDNAPPEALRQRRQQCLPIKEAIKCHYVWLAFNMFLEPSTSCTIPEVVMRVVDGVGFGALLLQRTVIIADVPLFFT